MSIITLLKIKILKHKARRVRAKMLRLPNHLDCGINLFPDHEYNRLNSKFRTILDELAKIDPEFPKSGR